jgi:hypothetical protein
MRFIYNFSHMGDGTPPHQTLDAVNQDFISFTQHWLPSGTFSVNSHLPIVMANGFILQANP